jgi:WD40 repeat protein
MSEESLFLAALDHTDAADRQAFLDRACAGDAEVRRRVELLLAAYAAGHDKLEPAAQDPATTQDYHPAARPGDVIAGRYKLLQRIGEGGMGEVWLAKQTEPVQRKVALKLIKAGMDSAQVLARFEAERQALALMDHPNIAKVLDGGLTRGEPGGVSPGRPFFVMELVNGLPLTKFCDDARLTPRERLELFVPVCQAIQHAHQKGIVHRDLKPSNVLVTLYDGQPVPKVIDFGVAKATGGKLTDESLATQFGAVLGTLEYMAPEQAGFSALDVDTRADIYALGVILYELLTGLRPFDSQRLRKAAVDEAVRIIREEEPPRPSTRLSREGSLPSLAAVRKTEPKRLMRLMRGELDWVVMKCLEKDRNRRYETANGLARDVQRYLHDEAVEARPPAAGYKLRKFLRRHRGPMLAAALVLLAVLVGAGLATWQAVRATWAEGEAKERRQAAEKAEGTAKEEQRRAERHEDRALHNLYIANMHRIRFELENNNVSAARALLDLYREPGTGEKVRRGWEWYYWDRVCHAELQTLEGDKSLVKDVAYSPDGALLASAGGEGDPVVKIWDAATGDELRALHGYEYQVWQVAFSPDGKILATSGSPHGTVKLWGVATWTEVPGCKLEPGEEFQRVAFAPDSKTLAVSEAKSKRVKFWDVVGKKWAAQLPAGTNSHRIQYSPDGNLIAVVRPDGVQLWDLKKKTLLRTLTGHSFFNFEVGGLVSEAVTGLAFSPDGQLLATCSQDGTVKMRKVLDGTEVRTITVIPARLETFTGLTDLAFSPDGKYLVTSGFGIPLKLWEVATGREVRSFFGQVNAECVSFSPDGTRLASAGRPGHVKIWDAVGEPGQHLFLDEIYSSMSPTFSPDGTVLAGRWNLGANKGEVHVRDADTGRLVAKLDHSPSSVSTFAFSSDSTHVATASGTWGGQGRPWEVRLWDLRSRQVVGAITGFNGSIRQLAFSPGDRLLASAAWFFDSKNRKQTYEVKIWDVKTRKEQRSFAGRSMAFSPNGTTLAIVGDDASVGLFDLSTGQVLRTFPARAGRWRITFSPDGNRLCDGRAVWNVSDGLEVCALKGNEDPAVFSPDGMRLFSLKGISLNSGLLRVWDSATGDLLASIAVQGNSGVSLHPDGWRCAVASVFYGTWIVDARPLTPELRRKRDAHNLVAHLMCKPMLKDELLHHFTRMKTISEPLRREALALAADLEIPRWVFVFAAWNIVVYPNRPEDQYRRALRWLEEANRISPKDGDVLNPLGMALYRLGRFEDAAVLLKSSFEIDTASSDFSPPAGDLVFLAMAQHRLGQKEDARRTLAQARDPKFRPGSVSPHLWHEAEALIERKGDGP